ncbi:MAG: hypothetical protein NT129_03860 [Candidatus Aenigmarchaeota archaeon]|nr:hypothetical protein [Candidatus Aenigmarchaeota archaeon]
MGKGQGNNLSANDSFGDGVDIGYGYLETGHEKMKTFYDGLRNASITIDTDIIKIQSCSKLGDKSRFYFAYPCGKLPDVVELLGRAIPCCQMRFGNKPDEAEMGMQLYDPKRLPGYGFSGRVNTVGSD